VQQQQVKLVALHSDRRWPKSKTLIGTGHEEEIAYDFTKARREALWDDYQVALAEARAILVQGE
jgi:hypothetical protein